MQLLDGELERLRAQAEAGERSFLDPYAAEDRSEFFAVASEAFFEQPAAFARELPARVTKLEALLNTRAFADLQTLAHQLKGAGGGYGFAQITEVAARLEQALKSGAAEPEIKDRAADLCAPLRAVVVPETR